MTNDHFIANAQAITCADAIADSCDTGGTATLTIYDGTPPANVDAALSGNTVLAELTMSATAFGAAADAAPGATVTANAISDDTSANATGTASFFRIIDGGSTPRVQGTVGTSGADLNFNSVAIQSGAQVSVTSLTITVPEA